MNSIGVIFLFFDVPCQNLQEKGTILSGSRPDLPVCHQPFESSLGEFCFSLMCLVCVSRRRENDCPAPMLILLFATHISHRYFFLLPPAMSVFALLFTWTPLEKGTWNLPASGLIHLFVTHFSRWCFALFPTACEGLLFFDVHCKYVEQRIWIRLAPALIPQFVAHYTCPFFTHQKFCGKCISHLPTSSFWVAVLHLDICPGVCLFVFSRNCVAALTLLLVFVTPGRFAGWNCWTCAQIMDLSSSLTLCQGQGPSAWITDSQLLGGQHPHRCKVPACLLERSGPHQNLDPEQRKNSDAVYTRILGGLCNKVLICHHSRFSLMNLVSVSRRREPESCCSRPDLFFTHFGYWCFMLFASLNRVVVDIESPGEANVSLSCCQILLFVWTGNFCSSSVLSHSQTDTSPCGSDINSHQPNIHCFLSDSRFMTQCVVHSCVTSAFVEKLLLCHM